MNSAVRSSGGRLHSSGTCRGSGGAAVPAASLQPESNVNKAGVQPALFFTMQRERVMVTYVTSKENPVFRDCRKLLHKKHRQKEHRFLAEGDNLCAEAVRSGMAVDLIFCEGTRFGDHAEEWNFSATYIFSRELFQQLTETETSMGVLAVVRQKEYGDKELDRIAGSDGNVVILDRLQDPGNIGTIIRTAEGAGYQAVFCVKGTADVYAPKTVRAAAGSLLRMPILSVENAEEAVQTAHRMGKRIAVTDVHGEFPYYEAGLSKKTALIIGNEGNGVSGTFLDSADVRVTIPMNGALESLNASVAAGILMYEAVRE
jgi:TrmH family RNA methyltransferase